MSYEGYEELLCANGHRSAIDAYEYRSGGCPHCQAKWVWSRSVDQTNGVDERYPETMPAKLEVISEAVYSDPIQVIREVVYLCGGALRASEIHNFAMRLSPKLLSPARYRIPTDIGRFL